MTVVTAIGGTEAPMKVADLSIMNSVVNLASPYCYIDALVADKFQRQVAAKRRKAVALCFPASS